MYSFPMLVRAYTYCHALVPTDGKEKVVWSSLKKGVSRARSAWETKESSHSRRLMRSLVDVIIAVLITRRLKG